MHTPSIYTVFADYYQVNLDDFNHYSDKEVFEYTELDISERVISNDFHITIFTQRNMETEVRMYILENKPIIESNSYDLLKTASIYIPSGKLVLGGGTDNIESSNIILLPSGKYNVIITYNSLDTVSKDGLDGEDYYEFFLYPMF